MERAANEFRDSGWRESRVKVVKPVHEEHLQPPQTAVGGEETALSDRGCTDDSETPGGYGGAGRCSQT